MLALQQFGIWLVTKFTIPRITNCVVDFELYLVFRDIFTPRRKVGRLPGYRNFNFFYLFLCIGFPIHYSL
jgi:hypothetical protein